MLRRSVIKEAPALERILLTLKRAKETHARAPHEATEALSDAVRNYDQNDEPSDNKQSIFRFWRREDGSAVCNFESAPNHHADQEREVHRVSELMHRIDDRRRFEELHHAVDEHEQRRDGTDDASDPERADRQRDGLGTRLHPDHPSAENPTTGS